MINRIKIEPKKNENEKKNAPRIRGLPLAAG